MRTENQRLTLLLTVILGTAPVGCNVSSDSEMLVQPGHENQAKTQASPTEDLARPGHQETLSPQAVPHSWPHQWPPTARHERVKA